MAKLSAKRGLGLLKRTWDDFNKDKCSQMAAALSYFTVFALPPLLILLILVAGMVWDAREVEQALTGQFSGMIGAEAGRTIEGVIRQADRPGSGGLLPTLLSFGALAFGATGALLALQSALNAAWEVEPDPKQGGIKNFIMKRVLSLGMLLGLGFMLAVSLALTTAIGALSQKYGGGLNETVLVIGDFVLSFGVLTLLFGAMFKVLPDATIAWRDVWIGASVTAALFMIGKFALGFYLGSRDPGSVFGAAGSLALILIWIYYAAMILLFGAEFTQVWAESVGRGIEPKPGAVRVHERKVRGEARPADAGKGGDATAERDGQRAPTREPVAS